MHYLKFVWLFCMAVLGLIGTCQAHALYIDTPLEGSVGEKHDVKIYYSEFADRTKEKVSDWFSDVAGCTLWLIHPDGSRTQLETTAYNDHLRAGFIPGQKGIYRLEISHTTAEVPKKTAFQFNAFARVNVGEVKKGTDVSSEQAGFALLHVSRPRDKNKKFKVLLNGRPAADIEVSLFFPSGKTKPLKSDQDGLLHFTSDEKGIHFLEATRFEKDQAGKTKRAAYSSLWRCATQKIVF